MGGDFHARRKKEVMAELVRGKEIAVQLRTLLHRSVEERGTDVSPQALAHQIFRSFSDSLSQLTSAVDSPRITAVDCAGDASSAESNRKVKDRRGCYKRRRSSEYSWVTESETMEDGCAWRKYGQKNILNSDFPRCYYRCTHKHEGCKATKQVQRVKGSGISMLYQTTYFNHHTCTATQRAPPLLVESDPVERNLISFQTGIQSKQGQDFPNPIIGSSVKQEDTQSEDASDHEARSTLEDSWPDIIALDPFGYKPEWNLQASVPLDMEVNQLSDIDNFHYLI